MGAIPSAVAEMLIANPHRFELLRRYVAARERYEPFIHGRPFRPDEIVPFNRALWDAIDTKRALKEDIDRGDLVVVDRARFERLLAFARCWAELPESFLSLADHEEAEEGMDLVFKKFQPGDLGPLA